MNATKQLDQNTPGPDPKKSEQKNTASQASTEDVVNSQSDAQVTNDSDLSAQDIYDTPEAEEDKDAKMNNLRDALNNDTLPPLPDDEENGIVN